MSLPGNISIYSSSLALAVGSMIGLVSIAWMAEDDTRVSHLNAGLGALAGGLIGARALYVSLHWSYFQPRLGEVFAINTGGLSWVGALFGAMIAIWIVSHFSEILFAEHADKLVPLFATLSISAWLSCWFSGCAYGLTTKGWWGLSTLDEWGIVANRIPTQLIAMLLTALILWLIYANLLPIHFPGQAASLFLFGFSSLYFAITYLRGDPTPVWNGLRWDAWAALGFALLGLTAFLKLRPREA